MKLIIRKNPGELYAVFSCLLVACNLDYFKDQLVEKWGMSFDEDLEREFVALRNHKDFDLTEVKYFFDIEFNTRSLLLDATLLWESTNLDDYLEKLQAQDPQIMRQAMLRNLDLDNLAQEINNHEGDALRLTINALQNRSIAPDIKWNLLCSIEDPQSYVEKFAVLMKKYLPLLQGVIAKYKQEFEDFRVWMETNLNDHGVNFVHQHLESMNITQFDKIYLSYSVLDLSSLHINSEDNHCYLFLGLFFQKYVEERLTKLDIEQHLMVLKNFADKTRFEIIRLLAEEESFGQAIAGKLGVTTATVSYHLDFLLGASLVKVQRRSRKVFYSLNKEQVKRSLNFLSAELKLDDIKERN